MSDIQERLDRIERLTAAWLEDDAEVMAEIVGEHPGWYDLACRDYFTTGEGNLVASLRVAVEALERIVQADYRGNEPMEQRVAREALEEINKTTERASE